uniref:Uncharacterized protein n=1 Tax=Graphocephala atropunctata TaxID=36148 RepID=A0A1B6KS62_9HEMI
MSKRNNPYKPYNLLSKEGKRMKQMDKECESSPNEYTEGDDEMDIINQPSPSRVIDTSNDSLSYESSNSEKEDTLSVHIQLLAVILVGMISVVIVNLAVT